MHARAVEVGQGRRGEAEWEQPVHDATATTGATIAEAKGPVHEREQSDDDGR